MSVTKSVTSALVGVATDRGLVPSPETPVADALPPEAFASAGDRARFASVTIRDVLGMSAIDAPVPPHRALPEDRERQRAFLKAPNRTTFALTQSLLPVPGVSFQYTDITPLIATGIVEYATKKTALELADEALFGPMGFRNYEWMHQDASGIDNGAYGLRLRPIDMQKLGILYLNGGRWGDRPLLSRTWVECSFTPWIRSKRHFEAPNYGWYWWTFRRPAQWTSHVAVGWKGQRISVFPEKHVVVTMTALVEDEDEAAFYDRILESYVMPAVDAGKGDPGLRRELAERLEEARRVDVLGARPIEPRMVPTIAPKERHRPFGPR
jgi:CubicO group peptidase (beta-lactamase class C family)